MESLPRTPEGAAPGGYEPPGSTQAEAFRYLSLPFVLSYQRAPAVVVGGVEAC